MSAQSSVAPERVLLHGCRAGWRWQRCSPLGRAASVAAGQSRGCARGCAGVAQSVPVWGFAQSSAVTPRARLRRYRAGRRWCGCPPSRMPRSRELGYVGVALVGAGADVRPVECGRHRERGYAGVALVGAGVDVRPVECRDTASAATPVSRWSALVWCSPSRMPRSRELGYVGVALVGAGADVRPVECSESASAAAPVLRCSALGADVRPVECSESASAAASVSRWSALVWMFAQSSAATPRARLRRCRAGRRWGGCSPCRMQRRSGRRCAGGTLVGTGVDVRRSSGAASVVASWRGRSVRAAESEPHVLLSRD
jgi:hypothetical protein